MTRQLLGIAGMLLAVVGLAINSGLVVWIATAVLVVAVGWRLLASRRSQGRGPGDGLTGR